MSFCIKCGVELADSEPKCPLCGTVVYHPDIKFEGEKKPYPPYPSNHEETMSHSGMLLVMFVVSVIFLISLVLPLLCDLRITGSMTWSRYTVSAILLGYIVVILPIWFRHPNPVIFSSVDFLSVALFLLYIDLITHGGWFLSFAFPVVGGSALITVTVITLMRYVRRGHMYIFGGAFIANGIFMVLIEYLINYTFHIRNTFVWSIYPFVVCLLIGAAFIVIAICKPLREALHKKFFI